MKREYTEYKEKRKGSEGMEGLSKNQNKKGSEVMERLSKKSIFSYALGDLASQLVWTFVGMYLTVYYLDVVGLAPLAASAIMLVAKIWDAINDPMMGAICERSKSKQGRFRPFILIGAPFLAVFSVLTFTSPLGNGTAGVIWATITYIGAGMLYTLVNIPYGALASVMTTHTDERTKLNSVRGIGMQIGIIIVSFGSPLLLSAFSGNSEQLTGKSYTLVTLIFAIISLPMFYLVYRNSKEVITPNVSKGKVSIKDSLKVIATNKYLAIVIIVSLISMVAYMGRMATMAFYVNHCLGDFRLMSILTTIPAIGALIGNMITPAIVKRLGKFGNRNALALSMALKGITFIWIFMIPFDNIPMIIIAHIVNSIVGFGFAPTLCLLADSIDYKDAQTGVRSDGIAFAFYGLSSKLGNAVGGSLGIMLMTFFGYVAGEVVTPASQNGINITTNLVCGVLHLIAAIIPILFWKMTDKQADDYRELIKARDEKEAEL